MDSKEKGVVAAMKKLGKAIGLVGLAVVLLITSVLCGCGGSEKETNTIVFGWLADQTGSSAQAFKQVVGGMKDYLAEMEANDPIEGIKIKIITYDTRLEYARFPTGYQWLKGQGMDLLLGYQPETSNMTQADQIADKIPQYNFVTWPSTMDADWVYGYMSTYEYEGQATMDYLVNQWWPTQGKARALKVVHLINPEYSSWPEYRKGIDWIVAHNPGKVELKSVGGTVSQSAWASEIAQIKDWGADVVFMTTVGTSSGTFLKEVIARGYQGKIVASTQSVLGVWPLVTSLVSKADLDGLQLAHYYPLWSDGTSYSDHVNQMLLKHHPSDAAELKQGTMWISAWLLTQILTTAVRDAADTVGPENVDGNAINDALLNLNLEIDGMPAITVSGRGGHHTFMPYCRIIKYDAAKDDFFAVSDWILPPSFTG